MEVTATLWSGPWVPKPVLVTEPPVMLPLAVSCTAVPAVTESMFTPPVMFMATAPSAEVAFRFSTRTSSGLPSEPTPNWPATVSLAAGSVSAITSSRVSPASSTRPAVLTMRTALAVALPVSIPVTRASPVVVMSIVPTSLRRRAASPATTPTSSVSPSSSCRCASCITSVPAISEILPAAECTSVFGASVMAPPATSVKSPAP